MKTTWKDNISIVLVSIPIKIYPSARTTPYRMLCKKYSLPVHYKMICKNENNYFILEPQVIKNYPKN